ncbi:flavin reductase (NADPH) [Centruroides vittatus]|uniref:flavin reductase (NADPH) n=1 Tax=Centruroides vittatus TaxID=120091 RepID=UPI00350FCE61
MEKVPKKIVIFGATGNTGLVTTEYAIKNGYEVSVFIRDPAKLPADLKPHKVFVGDVLNQENVDSAIEGQDAVVVTLGTRTDLGPTTVLSEGLKNIINGMVKHHVKRITCCISAFLFWERSKVPEMYIPVTEDHERMLNVLKASDREWVALFPPHITSEPSNQPYTLKNDKPYGRMISKYDLAEIMVKCLTDEERIGHTIGMGYEPKS